MFKIGEFSKLTQVSIRMLRYYDEVGLLKPAKIDSITGYRLYSVEQIHLLNKIIYLRDAGFQVSEMLEIIHKRDCNILEILKKQHQIEKEIFENKKKLEKIELTKQEMTQGWLDYHYQIIMKSIPSYYVLSLRRVVDNYYCEGELWKEMSEFIRKHHIKTSSHIFTIYHDKEYKEKDVDIELCIEIENNIENCDVFTCRNTNAVEEMACVMITGPFSRIAGAYLSLAQWLQENSQYVMAGESRQIVSRSME